MAIPQKQLDINYRKKVNAKPVYFLLKGNDHDLLTELKDSETLPSLSRALLLRCLAERKNRSAHAQPETA